MTIAIVDYGAGNLRSVAHAFQHCTTETVTVSANPKDIAQADRIVLPGVGAFADCMRGLNHIDGMVEQLTESVLGHKKPFLGICVGLQLLADSGEEHGTTKGLGWIGGTVQAIKAPSLKIPHMGWNTLSATKPHPLMAQLDQQDVYFVHSYHFVVTERQSVIATTTHGETMVAALAQDNIMATQFHPEKSQAAGLTLLTNFLAW